MSPARSLALAREAGVLRLVTWWLMAVLFFSVSPFSVRADVARRGLSISGIDELLHATGADRELDALSLQASLAHPLSSALANVPSDLSYALRQVVERDFEGAHLTQRFRELFAARSNKPHVQKLLAFYQSPLGVRYAQTERRARPGAAPADSKPLSKERAQLVDRWLTASWGMRRFEVEVVTSAAGLNRAINILAPKRSITPDELAKPMRSPELHAAVVLHFANSLSGFNDAELARITSMERSSAGQWYRRAELDALTQTVEEAFRALELEAVAARERMAQRYGSRTP